MTLLAVETAPGPIVAGAKLSADDHPRYRDRWTVQSSVHAFIDLSLERGVIFPEVAFGGTPGNNDGWRASNIGYCRRKSMLTRLEAPRTELTDSTKGKFMFGHMIEQVVVAALQADPRIEWLDSQMSLYDPELDLHGHFDGRIRILDTIEPEDDGEPVRLHTGRVECIEIKSINSNAMRYAKELPRDYHILQICSYIGMLRKQGIECDSGRVIYVSKDNWLLEERGITLTASRWAAVTNEVDALNELYEAGQLPRRLPSKAKTFKRGPRKGMTVIEKAWKCGYCEFAKTVCFPEEGEAPNTIAELQAMK